MFERRREVHSSVVGNASFVISPHFGGVVYRGCTVGLVTFRFPAVYVSNFFWGSPTHTPYQYPFPPEYLQYFSHE